jgi:hypothetical protein
VIYKRSNGKWKKDNSVRSISFCGLDFLKIELAIKVFSNLIKVQHSPGAKFKSFTELQKTYTAVLKIQCGFLSLGVGNEPILRAFIFFPPIGFKQKKITSFRRICFIENH